MFLFALKVAFLFTVPCEPVHVWIRYLVLIFGKSYSRSRLIEVSDINEGQGQERRQGQGQEKGQKKGQKKGN